MNSINVHFAQMFHFHCFQLHSYYAMNIIISVEIEMKTEKMRKIITEEKEKEFFSNQNQNEMKRNDIISSFDCCEWRRNILW